MSIENEMNIEILNIPIEAQKTLKLDWKIYENINPTFDDSFDMSGRAFETDIADKYAHSQGVNPKDDMNSTIYAVLPILSELTGKPWNNLAFNIVCSLSPSLIRVIKRNTGQTCDAYTNRVTVYLKEDDRTIDKISLEARCASIGTRDGCDLKAKMNGVDLVALKESGHTPGVYINSTAISKLDLKE